MMFVANESVKSKPAHTLSSKNDWVAWIIAYTYHNIIFI